jgi:hypothetical protein
LSDWQVFEAPSLTRSSSQLHGVAATIEEPRMKRIMSAVVMVAIVAGLHLALAPAAKAADVDGGWIGGVPLGGARAEPPAYSAPPPPVYYAPPPAYVAAPVHVPAPVYEDEPECRLIRQQYWDGYGYRIRRARGRVCARLQRSETARAPD